MTKTEYQNKVHGFIDEVDGMDGIECEAAIKSLILEVVEAVTPEPDYDANDDEGFGRNQAISEIKSKASELLG